MYYAKTCFHFTTLSTMQKHVSLNNTEYWCVKNSSRGHSWRVSTCLEFSPVTNTGVGAKTCAFSLSSAALSSRTCLIFIDHKHVCVHSPCAHTHEPNRTIASEPVTAAGLFAGILAPTSNFHTPQALACSLPCAHTQSLLMCAYTISSNVRIHILFPCAYTFSSLVRMRMCSAGP